MAIEYAMYRGDEFIDKEGKNWFRAVLFSDTGENCEIEDYLGSLPKMLVGIELMNIRTED